MAYLTNVKFDWMKMFIFLAGIYIILTLTQENLTNEVADQPTMAQPKIEQDSQAKPQEEVKHDEKADTIKPEDLLPVYDEANEFAKQNPVSKLLEEQNFLVSGYHVGINTVMQSNKIPYHDIRSLPPIPKEYVGPWSQSSYEKSAGDSRRQFEIGSA